MKTRYRVATIPIFSEDKNGDDFSIYTYSSYSSYPSHIINTNKPYPLVPLLPAFSYIPCQPIYLLSVFLAGVPPFVLVSVFAPDVPFSVVVPVAVDCVSLLPACRLVVSSGVPSFVSLHIVPFRSVPRLVGRVVGRCAVFVSSFSRVVSSWRCGLAGPFAPVVPLFDPSCVSVFPPSRRSSREASRAASRSSPRLVLP